MTNHDSREMVFNHDRRQVEEQGRARSGVDGKKVQELHDAIREGSVDVGPIVQHSPIDPALRPNVQPQMNGHKSNGWNPH